MDNRKATQSYAEQVNLEDGLAAMIAEENFRQLVRN